MALPPIAGSTPNDSFETSYVPLRPWRFSSSMSSSTGSTANGASTSPCTSAWNANVSFGQGEKATVSVRIVIAG